MKLPNEIEDKILWLLILLPGFLSFTIIDVIAGLVDLSDFQIITYSFALTMIDISIAIPIYYGLNKLKLYIDKKRNRSVFEEQHWTDKLPVAGFLIVLMIVSFSVGVYGGNSIEKDTFYTSTQKFRLFGLINRDSAKEPVDLVLYRNERGILRKTTSDGRLHGEPQKQQQWLRIKTKDGKTFDGYNRHYDLRKSTSQIFLSPACEVANKISDKVYPIKGAGVVIYEKEIEYIYLFDKGTICRRYWLTDPEMRKQDPILSKLKILNGY